MAFPGMSSRDEIPGMSNFNNYAMNATERATRSVFVGNIPYEATEEQLKDIFAQVGPVLSFRLVYDRETGKPKGYGFCEYQDVETAQSAMRNLNNHDFSGRPLRVGVAAGEQAMQQAGGPSDPIIENQFGEAQAPEKAPEAISKAVASLPPEQMFELMKQMKLCIQNNPNEARNMLLQNPQLAYALLQAQIVMKIVDPQVALAMLHRQTEQIPPLVPSEADAAKQQQSAGSGPGGPTSNPAIHLGLLPGLTGGPPRPQVSMAAPGPGPGPGPSIRPSMPLPGMPSQAMAPAVSLGGPVPTSMGGHAPGFVPSMSMGGPGPGQGPRPGGAQTMTSTQQNMGPRPGHDFGPGGPPEGRGRGGLLGDGPQGPRMGMRMDGPQGPESDLRGGRQDMNHPNRPGPGPHGPGPHGPGPHGSGPHGPGRGDFGPQGGPDLGPRGPAGARPEPSRDPRQAEPRRPGMPGSGGPPRMQGPGGGPPAPGPGPGPGEAARGGPVSSNDQEKAALIMQVLQLSDEQIALLPPDQRSSILILKDQISRSTGGL